MANTPQRYVALLRGVNVGGKSLIKMSDLSQGLTAMGFSEVSTYIQSGNVLFSSTSRNEQSLASEIERAIYDLFGLEVKAVVISSRQLSEIVSAMPDKWGSDASWKYNTLFLLPPCSQDDVLTAIGELKPDIEQLIPAKGAILQSVEFSSFGRSRTGKLSALPVYKRITVRNYNTTMKLLELLQK